MMMVRWRWWDDDDDVDDDDDDNDDDNDDDGCDDDDHPTTTTMTMTAWMVDKLDSKEQPKRPLIASCHPLNPWPSCTQ